MGLMLCLAFLLLPVLLLVGGYLLVSRTKAVTDVSVTLLRKLLRRIGIIRQGDSCVVEPCPGGVLLTDVDVPPKLLNLTGGSITIPLVTVKRVQLSWPTSSSPLTLRVSGVSVKLLQRRTAPKPELKGTPPQSRHGKLRALETLLWQGQQSSSTTGWRPQKLQQLSRALLALALRNICVEVADVNVQYLQNGEPGPVLTAADMGAVDAVAFTVRSLTVLPVSIALPGAAMGGCSPSATCTTARRSVGCLEPLAHDGLPGSTGTQLVVRRWLRSRRLKALHAWFCAIANRCGGSRRLQAYNASRVSVTGVNVMLLSRAKKATQASGRVFTGQHPQQHGQQHQPQRKRVRPSGIAGGLAVQNHEAAGPAFARDLWLPKPEPEWDSMHAILRQWSVEVEVSLNGQERSRGVDGPGHVRRLPRQTLAVQAQGTFGIRSGRGRLPFASSILSPGKRQGDSPSNGGASPEAASPGPSRTTSMPAADQATGQQGQRTQPEGRQQAPSSGASQNVGSSRRSSGGSGACTAPFSVHINVSLKALLPELTPEATVQLLRMVDRLTTYQKYSKYWMQRPSVSVSQSPAAWWQHAVHAVINDCREHYPPRKLSVFLARRAEYIRTYKALRSMQHGFLRQAVLPRYRTELHARVPTTQPQAAPGVPAAAAMSSPFVADNIAAGVRTTSRMPSRLSRSGRWGEPVAAEGGVPAAAPQQDDREAGTEQPHLEVQTYSRPRGPKTVAGLKAQLARLETQLTVGQIMSYRTFVALWHSEYLACNPIMKERWEAALSIITNFVDALPTMEEDNEEDGMEGTDSRVPGDAGVYRSAASPSVVSLRVGCPRLGLKLVNKRERPPVPGTAGASWGRPVSGEPPVSASCKPSVDVFLVVLEGIQFSMPTAHHVALEAANIRASLMGSSSSSPKHVLVVPAPRESMELHGAKLDFSACNASCGNGNAQGADMGVAKPSASVGSIHPDAPISAYLSRYKVNLAPVEIALTHPTCLVACAEYLTRMVQLREAARAAEATKSGAATGRSSLHSLVMDSYKRNRVPLPSSMAAFMPKLQIFCPMVTARWLLLPELTPSLGGVSGQHSAAVAVAVVTDMCLSSRYVKTCYAALLLSASAQAHAEMYFQLLPKSATQPSHSSANAASAADSGLGGLDKGMMHPHRGPFGKVWLHPDDVNIAFPPKASGPREPLGFPGVGSVRGRRPSNRLSQEAMSYGAPCNLRSTISTASGILGFHHTRALDSYPFVPLLKIRSLSVLAMSQVPYEPAVPGTMTTHQTVGMHSIMAWFSPWQAKLVVSAIDHVLGHPVLAILRKSSASGSKSSGGASTPVAGKATSSLPDVDSQPLPTEQAPYQAPEAGLAAKPKSGSSVSLLVEVPLLTVNCFAEMPMPLDRPEDLHARMEAMQQSGSELQVPAWVLASSKTVGALSEWASAACTDPVTRWGLSLTPLLTANITNVRAGLRLNRNGHLHTSLLTTGFQVSDHQARFKGRLYEKVWLENAGRASVGSAAGGILLPDGDNYQLLGPLATRASAMRSFARDRRRAALCLGAHLAPSQAEKYSQAQQLWRRLLEVQQLQRASDFAMFLLSTTHNTAERLLANARLRPFDCYEALRKSQVDEEAAAPPTPQATRSSGAGSQPSPLPTIFNSPARGQDVRTGGCLGGSTPRMQRHKSVHARTVSGLCGLTANSGASRFGLNAPQHRKATSMVQVLNSVTNANLFSIMALRRSSVAATAGQGGGGSADTNALAARGQELTNTSRFSMSRIPEDSLMPPSRLEPAPSEPNALSRQTSTGGASTLGATSALPNAPSWRGTATMRRTSSSNMGRTAPSDAGSNSDPDGASSGRAFGMQSAFSTAGAESQAAALGSAPAAAHDLRHDCNDNSWPQRLPLGLVDEAQNRLGFVQAYRHFGRVVLCRHAVTGVAGQPQPDPWVTVVAAQAPSPAEGRPVRQARVSCQHLAACVGVHSLTGILGMVLQVRQAFGSLSASKTSRTEAPASPAQQHARGPIQLEAQVCVSSAQLKVVIEEKPRRLHAKQGPPNPGLTELTSVILREVSAIVKPACDPSPVAPGGLAVEVGISDVQVQDLQGCIEHRNVLVGNGHKTLSPPDQSQGSGSLHNKTGPCSPLKRRGVSETCRVEVLYELSRAPTVPSRLLISVHDPCLTWLRRYSNNLSYAVGVIHKAYRNALQRQARSAPASAGPSGAAGDQGGARTAQAAGGDGGHAQRPEALKSLPLVMEFKVFNVGLVLPGGAASRKEPIRRSVNNDALAFSIRSVAVCLPGNMAALRSLASHAGVLAGQHEDECGEGVSLDDDVAWMSSEGEIDRLIWSGLRLGDQHFPQLNEPAPKQDQAGCGLASASTGYAAPARQPQAVCASDGDGTQLGSRLAKHLQAAKANILNPLKEILQEAGQKRNKRRGEAGLLLIDEGPTGVPTGEFVPGYLSIPENDERALASVAALQHTTTTVLPQQPVQARRAGAGAAHGTPQDALERGHAVQQRAQQGSASNAAAGHAVHPEGVKAREASTAAEANLDNPPYHGASRANPPLVVFSAHGLAAFSCHLVPRVSEVQECVGKRPEQQPSGGRPGGSQPHFSPMAPVQEAAAASGGHSGAERLAGVLNPKSSLRLLASPELQDIHQLIDPVPLTGVVFRCKRHGGLQLHFCAPEPMAATLGPTRYRRMLAVLTDNVVEARSCFEAGTEFNSSNAQRKTTYTPERNFGPRPGQVPSFHLTVDWQKQLYAALESDPSWWASDKRPGMHPVEPCLQGCFTRCSLGLILTRGTGDLYLAFHSQQLHIADVRMSSSVEAADDKPTAVSSKASSVGDGNNDWRPTYGGSYSGASRDEHVAGCTSYEEDDEASANEGGIRVQDMYLDNDSTEMPDMANVHPVVDTAQEAFPDKHAVTTLLRSNVSLPASEAAHLAGMQAESSAGHMFPEGGECPHDDEHNCVRVTFAMLRDGTMANEIELCHTLVQWPYLTEMSLVSSIISIFLPNWGRPAAGPEASLRLAASSWFYFNLVLRDSQLYIPVLAPHLRTLEYGWRAADDKEVSLSAEKLQQLFASMAASGTDRATGAVASQQRASPVGRQPLGPQHRLGSLHRGSRNGGSEAVTSPLDKPVLSSNWTSLSMRRLAEMAVEEEALRLEEMGLALTMSALRVGHFSGGDGESILKIDLRNAAGFVRHSNAQVTNWLLPIKTMAMEYRSSVPLVEESKLLRKYIQVARFMVFVLKTRVKAARGRRADATRASAEHEPDQQGPGRPSQPPGRMSAGALWGVADAVGLGNPNVLPGGEDMSSIRSRNMRSVDSTKLALDLLVEQATARASGLLEQHKLPLPTSSATQVTLENLLSRRASVSTITLELDTAVVRGSFSNIPVWHALMDDLGLAMGLMQDNKGVFAPAPAFRQDARQHTDTRAPHGLRVAGPGSCAESVAQSKAFWNFRPSTVSVDVHVKSLAVVLCDDKPKSYGAPDVLTAAMERLVLQYGTEKRFYDHLPEQSGCVSLLLSAQFLNNSTGRWEHLLEPWPAELHLSDPTNPVFKASRTKYIFASSSELLKLNFHPSCLLTLGDTLTFVRGLSNRADGAAAVIGRGRTDAAAPDAEKPPSSREQMALTGSIMSRVPQRYLIQNMTGIMLSYWAPSPDDHAHAVPNAVSNKKLLAPGCSEELQVTPTAKEVKIVGPGGVVVTRLQTQVIVLKFEGSWMPIPDVSVDVVGKYCYDLHSPHDDRRAPVVVDVVLVGRTKILKIHSALYVQNSTRLRMGFRLHLPSALLARQIVLGHGDVRLPGEQDIRLRPLKPGEGRYLPVLAALNGTLYLEPRTMAKPACIYMPAEHDVIRLFPAVSNLSGQSGFIACGPPLDSQRGLYGNSPLHFAVKVKVKSRTEYSYTTFHAIEVPGPGEFAKASRPLEASIKITPTAVVTNSLPYHMEGYLITVSGQGKEPDMGGGSSDAEANRMAATHETAGVGTSGGLASPTLNGDQPRRLGRFRRAEAIPADASEEDRSRVMAEMNALVQFLKPRERLPDLGKMTANEAKCCLLALLRYELRWTAKRGAKEMELLLRIDYEPADKISWQDLGAFIEWAKNNIRRVQVQPGTTQHFYVDMHKQAILCIKVPELKLVSSRPVEVNHATVAASGLELEQLPEFMRLVRVDDAESFNNVMRAMQQRNRMELQKPLLEVVNRQFRDTAGAVGDKIGNTVREMMETFGAPNPVKGGPVPATAERSGDPNPVSQLDAFWHRNPEKIVRMELTVEPGPWQGQDGDENVPSCAAPMGPPPCLPASGTLGSGQPQAAATPKSMALAAADAVPVAAAGDQASSTAANDTGMGVAPPGSPAFVAIVMSTDGSKGGAAAVADPGAASQGSDSITAAQGLRETGMSSAAAAAAVKAPVSARYSTFACATDVAAAAASGSAAASTPVAPSAANAIPEDGSTPRAQRQTESLGPARTPSPMRPILHLLRFTGAAKSKGAKEGTAAAPADIPSERTVRFVDEGPAQVPPTTAAPRAAAASSAPPGLTTAVHQLSPAQTAEHQHIRIRLQIRPPTVPAPPPFVYRITKRIQTMINYVVPGAAGSREGPERADSGNWDTRGFWRVGSSTLPRGPRRVEGAALPRQQVVRVHLQVVPATEDAREHVRLRLLVVAAALPQSALLMSPPSLRRAPLAADGSDIRPGLRALVSTRRRAASGASVFSRSHKRRSLLAAADPAPCGDNRAGGRNAVDVVLSPCQSVSQQDGGLISPGAGFAAVGSSSSPSAVTALGPNHTPAPGGFNYHTRPDLAPVYAPPSPITPPATHAISMMHQEPSPAPSTGAAYTARSSEATPGTVVVLRSGSNSSISMPSVSPQPRGPRRTRLANAPAAGPGSSQELVGGGENADDDPPASQLHSPLAADNSGGQPYAVWSDNPAYLRGSGVSTRSVPELPTRKHPSDFKHHSEASVAAAGGRVEEDEDPGVLACSSRNSGGPHDRALQAVQELPAAAAAASSHGASGSYSNRFSGGFASSEGSEPSSRASGLAPLDASSQPTVGASSLSRSHVSASSEAAPQPLLLSSQPSVGGVSVASTTARSAALRRRSVVQPGTHSARIIPGKSARSATSFTGPSGASSQAGGSWQMERRVTWQAGSFGYHLATPGSSASGSAGATSDNTEGRSGMQRRRRGTATGSFSRRSSRGLPAIREALTPMASLDVTPRVRESPAIPPLSAASGGRGVHPRVPFRRRTADSVLTEGSSRYRGRRNSFGFDPAVQPVVGVESLAGASPLMAAVTNRGARLVQRISEKLAATQSRMQLHSRNTRGELSVLGATQHLSLGKQLEELPQVPDVVRSSERLRQSSLGRGSRSSSQQPSYRQLAVRAGSSRHLASTPLAFAKSAMQAVPRLPSMARNMGERIVDGGQHVAGVMLQGGTDVVSMVSGAIVLGGQQVATKVADTLIAGGQEVKESTEMVIAAAKPKIKHSLKTVAWQVTEAVRRRKQGDKPEMAAYKEEDPKAAPASKRKKGMDLAPKVLLLNLYNSLAMKEEDHVCRLSLYAPFWVDNRTGFDLIFKDLDAPAIIDKLPFLLWHPVRAPGQKTDATSLDVDTTNVNLGGAAGHQAAASTPRMNAPSSGGPARRRNLQLPPHKPALLNDMSRTRFRVDDGRYSKTEFSVAFTVSTTSQKYSVDIKAERHEMLEEEVEALLSRGATTLASPSGGDGRRSSQLDRLAAGLDSPRPRADRVRKSPTNILMEEEPVRLKQLLPLPPLPPADMQHDLAPSPPRLQLGRSRRQLQVQLPQPEALVELDLEAAARPGATPQQQEGQQCSLQGEETDIGQRDREQPDARVLSEVTSVELAPCPEPNAAHDAADSGAALQAPKSACEALEPASQARPALVPALALPQAFDLHRYRTQEMGGVSVTGKATVPLPEITPVEEQHAQGTFNARPHMPLPSLADIPEHPVAAAIPEVPSLEASGAPLSSNLSNYTVVLTPASGCDRISGVGISPISPHATAAPARAGTGLASDTLSAQNGAAGDGELQRGVRSSRRSSGGGASTRGSGGGHTGGGFGSAACDKLSQICDRQPKTVCVRRLYQFAVEVWPAPDSTVFRRTKVITIKNKYLILNATGLTIEYKQKGTPDPGDVTSRQTYGIGRRFSGTLWHNWRAAWHWDNAHADEELMIRPAGDEWEWSGSFKLPENEDYFGLRIRHRHRREYVIIPVNITVGAAGSVLVTLKSKESVPPYKVINRCRDVIIRLKQVDWPGRSGASRLLRSDNAWEDWDEIVPNANASMPFAWDEPRLKHTVRVVATTQREPSPGQVNAIDVDLDAVDANTIIYVQSRAMQQQFMPLAARTDQREKLKYLSENAKKVYVRVYADGPTRVLCFSEDRTGMANVDDENSLINLSYRLQQVATRLKEVEHRLVLQLGNAQEQARGTLAPVGSGSQAAAMAAATTNAASPETEQRFALPSHGNVNGPGSVSTTLGPSSAALGPAGMRRGARGAWSVVRTAFQQSVSGTATPPSLRQGVPPAVMGFGTVNLQRDTSMSRYGSVGALAPMYRLPSIQGAAGVRPHHTRNLSGQGQGAGQPVPTSATVGLPQLLAAAPIAAGGSLTQLLEQLPAYGNDVDVPIGGDLAVVLRYVDGLTSDFRSNEKLVAVEAKMFVQSSDPGLKDKQDRVQATASWLQVSEPAAGGGWLGGAAGGGGGGSTSRIDLRAYEETFRDIPASAELQIDFFIAKGTYQPHVGSSLGTQPPGSSSSYGRRVPRYSGDHAAHATAMRPMQASVGPQMAVSSGQFAGCVRVPLLLTLGREKHQEWRLPLERKSGSQLIRGYVVVSFEWSFTNEGMLIREVAALERILAEKIELLALLNPLPATTTSAFVRVPGSDNPFAAANMNATNTSTDVMEEVGLSGGAGAGEGTPPSLGAEGATAAMARTLPARRTAKAMSESYYVNLEVSVLEVTGLLPREGVRASIAASLHGRQPSGAMSTAMLPRAVVSMSCGGVTRTAQAGVHSVHPRFAKNTFTFQNVPLGAKVQMQVLDQVSSSYTKLLAEAEMHVSDIPGTDPLYAWLALPRRKRNRSQRSLALLMTMEEEGDAAVQVLVRIKIHKPQVHGVLTAVTLDLAGFGLCAKTNLEELFNFTIQKVRASLVQTRTELQVTSAVQTIQLDNQMLEASNPVVLSPADGSQSSSVAHARRRHKARLARRAEAPNPILRLGHQDPSVQDPLLTFQMTYNQASSNQASDQQEAVPASGQRDNVGILAFKKVVLELGPLDFSADQEFIERVIAYLNAMPLADLHQDEAWQKQIDAMQGGGMAANAEDAAMYTAGRRDRALEDALEWLVKKEATELELLRGQSSMWFYLEEFYLSDIFINVTLALSSSFNAGVGGTSSPASTGNTENERQRTLLRSFLSRVSGSNGFQLINVTNAPIQLEYVAFQNRLYNRVSLVNTLWRHYSWIAIAQARKVLGGAGPAIAAIPASVLWASLALVDLGQDVAAKRVRPYQVPLRIGYVMCTLTGQVIGVLSRTMCAVMGVLPPRFSADSMTLTDSEAARRFAVKPQTVMDALYLGQRDVVLGVLSAAFGFVHDTAAGLRWPNGMGVVGLPVGLAKAALGVAMRPAAGTVEATSKLLQGVGLLCLGKRGIQGKLVRRVQAPGLAITDVVQAARASAVQEAYQAALIAAWQSALPGISSSLAGDKVVDVVAARPTRVVLLTSRHLVYILARRHAPSSSFAASSSAGRGAGAGAGACSVSYRVKWVIRNDHIDNIRGLERGYAVSVEYHKPVKLGRMSLKLPLRKGMRTSTAEGHKNLIFRLNRHIGHATSGASRGFGGLAAAASGGAAAGVDVQELRITMPYISHAGAAGAVAGAAGSQGVPLGLVPGNSLTVGGCADGSSGSAGAQHMGMTSRGGGSGATS